MSERQRKSIAVGLVVIGMLSASCREEIRNARVGDAVTHFHVIDVVTGKCIRVGGSDRYIEFVVEPDDRCVKAELSR